MGQVQNLLVVSIGVNSSHQTAFNAKLVQQYLGEGSQAVGGAGSVGNDVVFFGIIFILVYTHNDGNILTLCRSGDDNLFSASFQMSLSLSSFGKAAGGFNYDISANLAPRNLSRIRRSKYGNLFAINNDVIAFTGNFMVIGTMYRVIFQQMSQSSAIAQIVNTNNLYLRVNESYTENLAANAAKTINTNFCHNNFLLSFSRVFLYTALLCWLTIFLCHPQNLGGCCLIRH